MLNYASYANIMPIMLYAPAMLLCQCLCWHNPLGPNLLAYHGNWGGCRPGLGSGCARRRAVIPKNGRSRPTTRDNSYRTRVHRHHTESGATGTVPASRHRQLQVCSICSLENVYKCEFENLSSCRFRNSAGTVLMMRPHGFVQLSGKIS